MWFNENLSFDDIVCAAIVWHQVSFLVIVFVQEKQKYAFGS